MSGDLDVRDLSVRKLSVRELNVREPVPVDPVDSECYLREEGRRIGGVAFEGGVVGLLGSGEAEKDLAVWSTEEVEMVVGLEVKAW